MFRAILLFLFLGVSSLYAQTIPLRHFTDEDGLVSNIIYSIFRDRDGYLWFTSDKGISRYNGLSFENFTTADGMPDNEVFNVKQDSEGRIWLSSFSGALCYFKDGKFYSSLNAPWLKLPFKSPILRSFIQSDGSICFIFNDGSRFVNIVKNRLSIYAVPSSVSKLYRRPEELELQTIKKRGPNRYRLFFNFGQAVIDTAGNVLALQSYPDSAGYHYFLNHDGANIKEYFLSKDALLSPTFERLFSIKHKLNFQYSVAAKIYNHHSFVGLLNGVSINDSIVIPAESHVTYIEDDNCGNLYYGTLGNGVYTFSGSFMKQQYFQNIYEGNVLYAKVKDGVAFFATNYGSLFEIKGSRFRSIYKNEDYKDADKNFLTSANFLISDSIDYVILDAVNALVIPDASHGISGKRKFPFHIQETIKELFFDKNRLIIGMAYRLSSLDFERLLRQGKMEETKFNIRQAPGDKRIYGRDVDHETHSLWFSQEKRLYELKNGEQIEQPAFRDITLRQFELFKDYIVGLSEKNVLIIAGSHEKNPVVESIISKDCVWSQIYQIDATRAIISTNNNYRMLILKPAKKNAKPEYDIIPLENRFVPLRADYIAGDSINCYFFKNGSATQISTALLFKEAPAPVTLFTSLKTKNKSYIIKPKVNISYTESKSITITFNNISFVGKDIVSQYSISENNTDDWREITGNEINLNTPGYGDFTIKVRSKTLSSGYSRPETLLIKVAKPFWATWWFISICILSMLGLIWAAIIFVTWRKLRKKQKEHEADMKFQQSEYKALNALMNPHFIFNSLNNIQGLINKDEKRTANEYLVIFSDLVRQNMHNVSKGFISLQQELTLIANYLTLEKLRFKELVNYEIIVSEDVDIDGIMIPPLMIQPLVENAVKHGLLPRQSADSKVLIQVYEREDVVFIIVEDNGIGLTASLKSQNKLHESFGLSNLQKRTDHLKKIQQHELNIEVNEMLGSDGEVLGTKATVTIKLN